MNPAHSLTANAIHHIAIATRDIREQIRFFCDVLGMELVALFPMHGIPEGKHCFLKLGDHCSLSFVQLPEMADIEVELGKTHAGSGAGACAGGAMQHLAFNVPDDQTLLALRDRIRSHGVHVFGPIDHGMCRSIYFAGPEHLALELATSDERIDADLWVDPQVCREAGISDEELRRFLAPAPAEDRGGSVAQPAFDLTKPRLAYPDDVYRQMITLSDEDISKGASYPDPPVARKKN